MVPIVRLSTFDIAPCLIFASYVEAPELFDYFKGCAVKWNCMQYIKLSHRVVEATWNENSSRWHLRIEDIENSCVINEECDVLLSGTGILKSVESTVNRTCLANAPAANGGGPKLVVWTSSKAASCTLQGGIQTTTFETR